MELIQKLATIQTKLKAKKSRFNKFGNYYYRSAEDILEALKPFLLELDVTVTTTEELISSEPSVIQSTATIKDKLNEISATAVVGVDIMFKGQAMPQRYGTASSYAKKYALGNLFLIDDTQDSDATNTHGKDKLQDIEKAVSYVKAGGKIDAIKKKYQLTPQQEEALKTV